MGKNPPTKQETQIWSLGREEPLEEGMATCSSVLDWRIPWTEEPGRLQSIGLQRVGYQDEWSDLQQWQLLYNICSFLLHNIMKSQPHTYPLPLEPPSHPRHPTALGYHRSLSWVPCAMQHLPLAILHMVVFIYQCYSLNSSPHFFPKSTSPISTPASLFLPC